MRSRSAAYMPSFRSTAHTAVPCRHFFASISLVTREGFALAARAGSARRRLVSDDAVFDGHFREGRAPSWSCGPRSP